MSQQPEVLLLDDGELDDIEDMLTELGVAHTRVRWRAMVPGQPWPTRLLITTPGGAARLGPRHEEASGPVAAIALLEEDAPAPTAGLREAGFDYLVRRPVHPVALRMLVVNCVYAGEERRREPRIPVGGEIWFSLGLLDRPAVLADLSTGGCRLLTRKPLEPGRRVMVEIPESLGAAEPLRLKGRVLRCEREHGGSGYSSAIQFEDLSPDRRDELEWILEERSHGPVRLAASQPDEVPENDAYVRLAPEGGEPGGEAEADPRKRVLVARDITSAGMRVESQPGIELGDRLHMALYLSGSGEPLALAATFVRDEGPDGMILAFDEPPPAIRLELEMQLRGLPSLEDLHDRRDAPRVVAELLDA